MWNLVEGEWHFSILSPATITACYRYPVGIRFHLCFQIEIVVSKEKSDAFLIKLRHFLYQEAAAVVMEEGLADVCQPLSNCNHIRQRGLIT